MAGNVVVGSITVVVLWLGQMRSGLALWFGAVLAIVLVRDLHGRSLGRRIAAMPAAQLIDSLRSTFEAQAESRGLQLRIWAAEGAVFDTDPRTMQSMAHKLVGNAVRDTQQGGVLVAVQPWQGGWRLGIYDTGPGFDQVRLPAMCTPYRRYDDRENHPDGAGQGLGLALVERQARLLGHRLQMRSRPGHGRAFASSCRPQAAEAESLQAARHHHGGGRARADGLAPGAQQQAG